MSSVYDTLLDSIAADRGWGDEEKEAFNSWRDKVAEIESNGIADRVQTSGGPGRGKYQYELADGGSGANDAARNRLKALIGDDLPGVPEADRTELAKADPDFSKLSEDTQDALFLADKQKDAKTTLDDLVDGAITEGDAWASWHWKGAEEDLPAKLEMWNNRFEEEQEEVAQQETYTIKPGETLYQIAAVRGLNAEDLMTANNILDATTIQPGQQIILRKQEQPQEEEEDALTAAIQDAYESARDVYDYSKSQIASFLSRI